MRQRRHATGTVPEYLRRNEIVAKACGAYATVQAIEERLARTKRVPAWLIVALGETRRRLQPCKSELATHRDELQKGVEMVANAMNRGTE